MVPVVLASAVLVVPVLEALAALVSAVLVVPALALAALASAVLAVPALALAALASAVPVVPALVPADLAGIIPVVLVLADPDGAVLVLEVPVGAIPVLAQASAQVGAAVAVGDVPAAGACLAVTASRPYSSRSPFPHKATKVSAKVTSRACSATIATLS